MDVSAIKAELYFNGAFLTNLTGAIEEVSEGLFRIPYNIPLQASAGTYALEVQAVYGAYYFVQAAQH